MDIVGKYIRRKSVEGHHQRRSSGSGPTSSGSRRNSKSDNTNKENPFVAMCLPDREKEMIKMGRSYLINILYSSSLFTFFEFLPSGTYDPEDSKL